MHERTTDTAETAVPLPEPEGRSYTPGESERPRAMTSVEAGRAAGRPHVSREPLVSADRLLRALLAGMFVLVAAVLSAGAVAFNALSDQMLGIQQQIGGLQEQIGGLHEEIGGLRTEMHEEIGELRAEMHEEIGDLRAEMREEIGKLSERMTRVETLLETHLVPASDAPDPAGP